MRSIGLEAASRRRNKSLAHSDPAALAMASWANGTE